MTRVRVVVALLAVEIFCHAVFAIDVSKVKHGSIELTDKDVVQQTNVKALVENVAGPAFVGDVVIGERYSDEIVFRRIIEFSNPSNIIQSTSFDVAVTSGIINYLKITNNPSSYGVVCVDPLNLGNRRILINLRVPPNSRTTLTMVVASH